MSYFLFKMSREKEYNVLSVFFQVKSHNIILISNKDDTEIMLCRACGGEMIALKYCSDCNEVIQSRCNSCKKEDETSMHSHHL
jgi:predicted RNA-binding Zn-ribbon protein involved in translation (DUF1610 family)